MRWLKLWIWFALLFHSRLLLHSCVCLTRQFWPGVSARHLRKLRSLLTNSIWKLLATMYTEPNKIAMKIAPLITSHETMNMLIMKKYFEIQWNEMWKLRQNSLFCSIVVFNCIDKCSFQLQQQLSVVIHVSCESVGHLIEYLSEVMSASSEKQSQTYEERRNCYVGGHVCCSK